MITRATDLRLVLAACSILSGTWSCSSNGGSDTGNPTVGGATAIGGAQNLGSASGFGGGSTATARGGATSSKSDVPSLGGGASTSGGASSQGSTTTAPPSSGGGVNSGGTRNSGGSASGGKSPSTGGQSGGTATGGKASGGSGVGGAGGSGQGGAGAGRANAGGAGTGAASTGGATSTTCPSTVLKPGDTTQTIQVGSRSRSFVLHVPAKYDGTKPVPLIVDFHPLGGSGQGERTSSPYPAQTDPEGVIMAFPSGLTGPSGGAWNVGPCCVANTDDVAFAKALVAQIQQSACIDPKRIYAVGFSMGGGMSHYLACHAADLFAAVAPAAFDLLQENVTACKPARPITVVSFRGTGDTVVPYAGGPSAVVSGMPVTFLGAANTFKKWAELNQCTGSPSAQDPQGCSTYSNCQAGVEVMLCTKQGGGHEAGNAAVGWPVLKRHTLP